MTIKVIEAVAVGILGTAVIVLCLPRSGIGSSSPRAATPPAPMGGGPAATTVPREAGELPPEPLGVPDERPDPTAVHADAADYQRLVGRWRRPDGGYVLDIRGVESEGKLDAAYLNPRPIHVSRAQANMRAGRAEAFVELTDRDYPGSYYTVAYDPATDRLVGVYHHLGIGQDFDVEFVRLPRSE